MGRRQPKDASTIEPMIREYMRWSRPTSSSVSLHDAGRYETTRGKTAVHLILDSGTLFAESSEFKGEPFRLSAIPVAAAIVLAGTQASNHLLLQWDIKPRGAVARMAHKPIIVIERTGIPQEPFVIRFQTPITPTVLLASLAGITEIIAALRKARS